jgi:hypothetical protein
VLEDRSVWLETTWQGAGVLRGDLTPTCAAAVATVLDALSAPAGADDTRTHAERYHDALEEAIRKIAVLSAAYLESVFATAEWEAACRGCPLPGPGRMLPLNTR